MIVSAIALVLVVIIILLFVYFSRRRKTNEGGSKEILNEQQVASNEEIQDNQLQNEKIIPHKNLKIRTLLGSGAFGKVYSCEWKQLLVAVKVCQDVQNRDDFLKEALIMTKIPPHPNIVQVLGVSIDGPEPSIVLEYCPGGSLDKWLFDTSKPLTIQDKKRLIKDIAQGLHHLHQNNIVHGDLASRNILLGVGGEAKISDFGMSRVFGSEKQEIASIDVGPIKWMAPETLETRAFSKMSDVWSFGIVVYEIIARKLPHEGVDSSVIGKRIRDEGLTPEIPDDCEPIFKDLMEACWQFEPEKRPTIRKILEILSALS